MVNVLFEYHTVFMLEVYYIVLELSASSLSLLISLCFGGSGIPLPSIRIYHTEKDWLENIHSVYKNEVTPKRI